MAWLVEKRPFLYGDCNVEVFFLYCAAAFLCATSADWTIETNIWHWTSFRQQGNSQFIQNFVAQQSQQRWQRGEGAFYENAQGQLAIHFPHHCCGTSSHHYSPYYLPFWYQSILLVRACNRWIFNRNQDASAFHLEWSSYKVCMNSIALSVNTHPMDMFSL